MVMIDIAPLTTLRNSLAGPSAFFNQCSAIRLPRQYISTYNISYPRATVASRHHLCKEGHTAIVDIKAMAF